MDVSELDERISRFFNEWQYLKSVITTTTTTISSSSTNNNINVISPHTSPNDGVTRTFARSQSHSHLEHVVSPTSSVVENQRASLTSLRSSTGSGSGDMDTAPAMLRRSSSSVRTSRRMSMLQTVLDASPDSHDSVSKLKVLQRTVEGVMAFSRVPQLSARRAERVERHDNDNEPNTDTNITVSTSGDVNSGDGSNDVEENRTDMSSHSLPTSPPRPTIVSRLNSHTSVLSTTSHSSSLKSSRSRTSSSSSCSSSSSSSRSSSDDEDGSSRTLKREPSVVRTRVVVAKSAPTLASPPTQQENDGNTAEKDGTATLDDTNSEESEDVFVYFLQPDRCRMMLRWWGVAVFCCIIYNTISIPLRVSFSIESWPWLDSVADVVYAVDTLFVLLLIRCTAEQLELVVHPEMRTMYTFTNLMLSLLSCMPAMTMMHCYAPWFVVDDSLDARETHVYRIVRLIRLSQASTLTQHWEAANLRTSWVSPNAVKLFKLAVYMYGSAHIAGCGYMYLSYYEGFPDNDWTVNLDIRSAGDVKLAYIHCIYWAFSAMTGIGAGVEVPRTTLEHTFTTLVLLVGITLYATLVGNLSQIIANMHTKVQGFLEKMEAVNQFCDKNHMPESLAIRLRNCFEYLHHHDQLDNEWDALANCPRYLRNEIMCALYENIVRNVRLFKYCEDGFIRSLVICLKPQVCLPGDWLIRQGEVGREMYLVRNGKLNIIVKGKVVATISDGSYVGEIAILYEQKRIADVQATTFCDLLMLTKDDMDSVVDHYPDVLEQMEREAKLYPSIQKMLKERHKKLQAQIEEMRRVEAEEENEDTNGIMFHYPRRASVLGDDMHSPSPELMRTHVVEAAVQRKQQNPEGTFQRLHDSTTSSPRRRLHISPRIHTRDTHQ